MTNQSDFQSDPIDSDQDAVVGDGFTKRRQNMLEFVQRVADATEANALFWMCLNENDVQNRQAVSDAIDRSASVYEFVHWLRHNISAVDLFDNESEQHISIFLDAILSGLKETNND